MDFKWTQELIRPRPDSQTCRYLAGLFFLAFAINPGWCTEPSVNKDEAQAKSVIAMINGQALSTEAFLSYFNQARRQTFYHAAVPPTMLEEFRVKTLQAFIDRHLLLAEASRQGLQPDSAAVETQIQRQAARYQDRSNWEQNKDAILTALHEQLTDGDLLQQLEDKTRQVTAPSAAELETYYQNNPDKFTEPMQRKVSLILIGVEPSAAKDDWEAAHTQTESLITRLHEGADFASLAQEHSSDETSASGGSMGYLHQGMLNEQAEKALSELDLEQISGPVRTLEGYAVFRLDAVREPVLKTLKEVQDQAVVLWQREQGENAWNSLKEKLRQAATIEIIEPGLDSDIPAPEAGS